MKDKVLIHTDMLVDGTGTSPRKADILIHGDRVEAVGLNLKDHGAEVIDAMGLVVSPGFIDAHSHSDFTSIVFPDASGRIFAGVTTDCMGQCGMSAFPMIGESLKRRKESFEYYEIDIDWDDLEGYIRRSQAAGSAINRVPLVGHGNLRGSVIGYTDRPATAAELAEMKRLLARELAAGAFGMSSGLIYPPGLCSSTDELAELAAEVAKVGGVYTSHLRSESDSIQAAVEEHLEIMRRSGVRGVHSHVKVTRKRNFHKIEWLERTLNNARLQGLELYGDCYPYTVGWTGLEMVLPNWALKSPDVLKLLADPAARSRMKADMIKDFDSPDDPAELRDYFDGILMCVLSSEKYQKFSGSRVSDAAAALGRDPFETLFDILLAEKGRADACYFRGSEENMRRIMKWPFVMVGSDSSVRTLENNKAPRYVHPRCFGTSGNVLGNLVRQEKVLSLEEAVYKMTALPAKVYGIAGRGTLAPGAFADVTIFDPATVGEASTWTHPCRYCEGFHHVMVNGSWALREGKLTGARAGRLLRKA